MTIWLAPTWATRCRTASDEKTSESEEAVRVDVDRLDAPAVERDRQAARIGLLCMRGGMQATPAKHDAGCSSRSLHKMSAREHRTVLPEIFPAV